MEMQFLSPSSKKLIKERNRLLGECLREEPQDFPIEKEYPIVLDPMFPHFSHCLKEGSKIIAHANIWPRVMVDASQRERYHVFLVGNVATHQDYRNKGIMRELLASIEEMATSQKACGLILWSDLSSFYHKLGFKSLGREYRFLFNYNPQKAGLNIFKPVPQSHISTANLEDMLALRPKVPLTLFRSPLEFEKLLTIPKTHLFAAFDQERIISYAICGKGADMVGVIHEWGGDPSYVELSVHKAMAHLDFNSLILLSPTKERHFVDQSVSSSKHPMAFYKPLKDAFGIEDAFIWGLDSI